MAEAAGSHAPLLEALLAEHYGWALRRARRLLAWHAAAEDVTHEVFLRAAGRIGQLRDPDKARAWLGRAIVNGCRAWQRREAIRRRLLPWRTRHAPPADGAALANEAARSVRAAVAALPPKLREAVVLHYFEGLPLAETAAALGERPNTVAVRLHRARELLAGALAEWREDS